MRQRTKLTTKSMGLTSKLLCWEDPANFDVWDDTHSTLEEERWLKFGRLRHSKIVCVVVITQAPPSAEAAAFLHRYYVLGQGQ